MPAVNVQNAGDLVMWVSRALGERPLSRAESYLKDYAELFREGFEAGFVASQADQHIWAAALTRSSVHDFTFDLQSPEYQVHWSCWPRSFFVTIQVDDEPPQVTVDLLGSPGNGLEWISIDAQSKDVMLGWAQVLKRTLFASKE